jgi:hypothetical protein
VKDTATKEGCTLPLKVDLLGKIHIQFIQTSPALSNPTTLAQEQIDRGLELPIQFATPV